ncbi:hypothetical protein ZWY2020_038681, partial [Hordeum vulgare]
NNMRGKGTAAATHEVRGRGRGWMINFPHSTIWLLIICTISWSKEMILDIRKALADKLHDLQRTQSNSDVRMMIFSAYNLDKIGGLVPVIQDLNNANEEIRTTSSWILGTASENNALVQSHILGYGALARLVKMGYSTSAKEAAKAMYAISALIRNNVNGQEAFALENGNAMLQHILGSNSVDVGLQKKAVFLLTDLADFQLNSGNSGLTFLSERFLLKSVTDMLSEFDLDLQEKVLLAIRSLLKLPSTDARDFKSCGLDSVLYRLGVQLEELPSEEQKEYAREVDALRREVLMFFEQKLKPGTAAAAVS